MSIAILGISAYYHDSAAVLLLDGEVIAAAQEERFTRKKHDSSFPVHAAQYVLNEAGLELSDLEAVVFYDKPLLKFERLLETYHAFAPKGLISFLSAMPVWMKEKLFMRKIIRDELKKIGDGKPRLLFPEHHLSHAASAFYPSPFKESAILTVDGVGEWATTMIAHGSDTDIRVLRQLDFPHSLGLLYSAFTYYCGFKVNSGEYKLMGLAPYGNRDDEQTKVWVKAIYDELIDLREDGSFLLNMEYFNYATGLTMCNNDKWHKLFNLPRRLSESVLTQPYMNLAMAIQDVTEEIVLRLARTTKELTGSKNLVMSGGVALNCVANGKLIKEGIFEDVWFQPAAGDAGGALGAAYAAWHIWKKQPRAPRPSDSMGGAYLGPQFSDNDIIRVARRRNAPYQEYKKFDDLCGDVAEYLAESKIVGWFQGRMEYGPRALGNRSILGDPRNPDTQKRMNLKIKYRESFRPFAPSVLDEDLQTYFDLSVPSPYMLVVAPVQSDRCNELPDNYSALDLRDRLYFTRSDIPAITHIDFSARVQTVSRQTNDKYWRLIKAFKEKTGCGLVVNTSFNVRGEPIVCTPEDAYRCFMSTEMDYLVMGNFVFDKKEQPVWSKREELLNTYELD